MDNEQTTYKATYHNNYPLVNGRQVFDKEGKVTLTNGHLNMTYDIINWHSFDDYGVEMETVTLKNVITERFSMLLFFQYTRTYSKLPN